MLALTGLSTSAVGDPQSLVRGFTRPDMLPAILEALHGIQRSFSGFQYVSDHPECFEILRSKVEHLGVKGKIIFDHNQFFNCSCTRQPARVRSLLQAGGAVRVYRPDTGGFACMHAKTWVLDAEVVLTGSPNTTENGLCRSKCDDPPKGD